MTETMSNDDQIDALLTRDQTLDEAMRTLTAEMREIDETIDRLRREMRPTYPTPEQIAGIAEAARRVHAGEKPSSHHGDPTAPGSNPHAYDVVVDGERGFIRLANRAPYSRRGGERLWDYTDEEIDAIINAVTRHGLTFVQSWRSSGISMIFARPA